MHQGLAAPHQATDLRAQVAIRVPASSDDIAAVKYQRDLAQGRTGKGAVQRLQLVHLQQRAWTRTAAVKCRNTRLG